jgi:phosphate-selective porin OprO/OprP
MIPIPLPPLLASLASLSFPEPAAGAPDTPDTPDKGSPPSLEERVSALEAGAARQAVADEGAYKIYWKDGLRFESPDGEHKLRFGGRIWLDWGWFTGDDAFDTVDGEEFRAARLYLSGVLWKRYDFKAQYDWAQGDADFKDVYMGVLDTSVGNVRVGQFKEPFSLELQTGANDITFMERATLFNLTPDRNTGLMVYDNPSERFTWAAGVFRDSDKFGDDSGDGEYNYTARVTGLPMYEDKGESLVHLGLGLSARNPSDDTIAFASKPEQNLVSAIAGPGAAGGTPITNADDYWLGGLEAAWVRGPFSLQAEYALTDIDLDTGSDPTYDAYYVYASWFLTGEGRPYKTAEGCFGRVEPERPWGKDGGSGAWELGLRYSVIDYDDGPTTDTLEDITVGLNWYTTSVSRVMLNYVHSMYDSGVGSDDEADLLGLRFQINF